MKKKWLILLFVGLIIVALLALLLDEAVLTRIILPIAKLIWLIKGYYGASLQKTYWVFALTIAALIFAFSFRLSDFEQRHRREHSKKPLGPVQDLSFWIQRARESAFPRWHVAHLMAELALDITDRRKLRNRSAQQLSGPDWNPPQEVKQYLDAAIASDYRDFKNVRKTDRNSSTPLDQDIEPVVNYLESYMEADDDHHS